MEAVKKAIAISGTPWEPCSANEYKINMSSLNHDVMVWFNFVKQSMLPMSHTTNVEKERMMLLDAILGAFPTILKVKKPAAASGDPTMLQQFIQEKKAMREFQRKQHLWLVSVLSKNLKESAEISVPEFTDWVIDEEALDDILFEEEMNEEEEEVVVEKKRKRDDVKESRKETMAEVKRGKKPVGEEEIEEEEDLLATDSDSESLSEEEKQENINAIKELRKESEEEDPASSNDEGEDFHDANDDLNAEPDFVPAVTEPVSEPTP